MPRRRTDSHPRRPFSYEKTGRRSGEFANKVHNHNTSDFTDFSVTTPTTGDVLIWDGANWVNDPGGSGSGLDADTVDGVHAAAFAQKAADETISGTWLFNNPQRVNNSTFTGYFEYESFQDGVDHNAVFILEQADGDTIWRYYKKATSKNLALMRGTGPTQVWEASLSTGVVNYTEIPTVGGTNVALVGDAPASHTHVETDITNLPYREVAREGFTAVTQRGLLRLIGAGGLLVSHVDDSGNDESEFTFTQAGVSLPELTDTTFSAPGDLWMIRYDTGLGKYINVAQSSILTNLEALGINAATLGGESASAFADAVHTHLEADITDLGNYSVVGHTHLEADITDLGAYLENITGESIEDLDDVLFGVPGVNHFLVFNNVNSKWQNAAPSSVVTALNSEGGIDADLLEGNAAAAFMLAGAAPNAHTHTKSEITDFAHTHLEADITDLQAYLLGITGEPIGDLSDVIIGVPAVGHYLRHNGSNWQNNSSATLVSDINSEGGVDADLLNGASDYLRPSTVATITEDWTWDNNAVYWEVEFSTSIAFGINYGTDTTFRLWIAGDGDMLWSDGSAAADGGLRRSGAGQMEFDNALVITGSLRWGGGSVISSSTLVSVDGHTHVETDITDLGNYVATNDNAVITGAWEFTDRIVIDGASTGETEIVFEEINLTSERYAGPRWHDGASGLDLARTGIAATTGDLFIQTKTTGGTWNKHLTFLRDGTGMEFTTNLTVLNKQLHLEGDFTSSIVQDVKTDTDASARWDINTQGSMRWRNGAGTTQATLQNTSDGLEILDHFFVGAKTGGTSGVRLEIHSADGTIGDPLILRQESTSGFNVIAWFLQTTRQGICGFDTTDNLQILAEISGADILILQPNSSASSLKLGAASGKLGFFNNAGAVRQTATGTIGNLLTILRSYNLVG